MTTTSDIIWNTITNSAKKRFDYNSFEQHFIDVDENLADNLLFKIIIGFASTDTDEVLSLELYNDMLMIGIVWKLENIQDFIKDKKELLSLEIYSCQLAGSLLEDGNDATTVLNSINQLLS